MLTAKQHKLLYFINERLEETGISPSFDEMKEALGLKSKSGIHRLIMALEERGFIRRLPNKARALEVLRLPDGTGRRDSADSESSQVIPFPSGGGHTESHGRDIPMHGRIAAGTPIEALEQVDSHISVPPDMLGPGRYFALTVDGDSMEEAGILDGDTVLIESCDVAHDGDIVVALVDDQEATLKRLKRDGPRVTLIPCNRSHQPQTYDAARVRLQGRLSGLLRRY